MASSRALNALRLAGARLVTVYTSEASLREEVTGLQSDNYRLYDQCKLAVSCGALTGDLLDSAREKNCSIRNGTGSLRAQYDEELADLWYE